MHEPTATAETLAYDDGSDSPELVAASPQRKGDKMRFHFPSGSRPLEGYTIKRGIGVGGFGEVYFATSDAGKEVALKRIQRNLDVELRGVRQCLNLKHVNLVALWDIKYDDEGEAWVVMEYIAGESLRDVVERFPQGMSVKETLSWFEGIVDGVAYLHDHGIVHRDLKPGNIFEDDDVVKIGDYGLSKFISCSRRGGQTESVGTCHYMAPEIGKGIYGKEIDVYALGVILYELLTGDVPFDGESSQEIIMKHLTAEPDVSSVSEPYRSVIRKALAKDPERRYSAVREMLKEIRADRSTSQEKAEPVMRIGDDDRPSPLVITDEDEEDSDTLYISGHDDVVMGDVQEIVDAEPIQQSEARRNPRQRHMRNEATATAATQSGEPIARAMQDGWGNVKQWWNNANFSNPVKVGLLIGAAIVLIINAQWLIPVLVVLGIIYLIYLGIRVVAVGGGDKPKGETATATENSVVSSSGRQHHKSNRRAALEKVWEQRTATERLTELTGSMILSALICGVLCIVAMIVGGSSFGNSLGDWSFYAWMTLTATCGSWMVLCVAKMFEVTGGDQIRKRFVMLVAGLTLGAMAFAFQQLLQPTIEFSQADRPFAEVFSLPSSMVNGSEVLLPAYLAYFGGLFVILRWWKQSDPLRRSRLSLWATGLCVLWALIIDVFPQPWGFLLAATIAIAVQLSAPWMSLKERMRIRQLHQRA